MRIFQRWLWITALPSFLVLFLNPVVHAQRAFRKVPTVSLISYSRRPNLWMKHQKTVSMSANLAHADYSEDNIGRDRIKALRFGFVNPPHDLHISLPNQLDRTIGDDIGLRLNKRLQQHIMVENTPATRKEKNYTIEMLINPAWENNWQGLASKATNGSNYSLMLALMPVANDRSYRLAFYTPFSDWQIAWGGRSGTPEYEAFKIPSGELTHIAASFGNCFTGSDRNEYCNIALYINGRMKIYGTMRPGTVNDGLLRIGSWYGPQGSASPAYLHTSPPVPANQILGDSTASANPEYNFSGIISETLFWDEVLLPEQIQQHADALRQGMDPRFR